MSAYYRLSQVGIILLFVLAVISFLPFQVDDAYISFTYAKNLATGNGLTYNGLVVEGYSNPLWTIVLSPIIGNGFDPLVSARIISVISGVIALLLVLHICNLSNNSPGHFLSFLATASVAVLSPMAAWTMGGLETIFLSLLLVLLVFNEKSDGPRYKMLSSILLLMIALTRPEGVIFFPIWLFFRFIRGNNLRRETAPETVFLLAAFALFLLWRWKTYGYLLPNTAYLKLEPTLERTIEAANWLLQFLVLRPIFALMFVSGIVFSFIRKQDNKYTLMFSLAIMVGVSAFVLFAGPDWMPHHRFIAPVAPLMALFIAVAIDAPKGMKLRMSMTVLAVIAIGFEVLMANTAYRPLSEDFGNFTMGLVRAGKWVNRNTSETETIAVVDAGAIAYYADRTTIDILGLNDTHIAHSDTNSDSDYVLGHRPVVIQLHVGFTDVGELLPTTGGAQNQNILEHVEFIDCYVPDLARPTDLYYPYLFIRTCN
jgi:hypothetical protein